MENKERELTESELQQYFFKWFYSCHPDKKDPIINEIKKDKIYFTYNGSQTESLIHTKLIQDLFDRGKI